MRVRIEWTRISQPTDSVIVTVIRKHVVEWRAAGEGTCLLKKERCLHETYVRERADLFRAKRFRPCSSSRGNGSRGKDRRVIGPRPTVLLLVRANCAKARFPLPELTARVDR